MSSDNDKEPRFYNGLFQLPLIEDCHGEDTIFATDVFDLQVGKRIKFLHAGKEVFPEGFCVLTSAHISEDGRSVMLTFEDGTPREARQFFGPFGPCSIDPDFQQGAYDGA